MVKSTAVFLKNSRHAGGVDVMDVVLHQMPGALTAHFYVLMHMSGHNRQHRFLLSLGKRNRLPQIGITKIAAASLKIVAPNGIGATAQPGGAIVRQKDESLLRRLLNQLAQPRGRFGHRANAKLALELGLAV